MQADRLLITVTVSICFSLTILGLQVFSLTTLVFLNSSPSWQLVWHVNQKAVVTGGFRTVDPRSLRERTNCASAEY